MKNEHPLLSRFGAKAHFRPCIQRRVVENRSVDGVLQRAERDGGYRSVRPPVGSPDIVEAPRSRFSRLAEHHGLFALPVYNHIEGAGSDAFNSRIEVRLAIL